MSGLVNIRPGLRQSGGGGGSVNTGVLQVQGGVALDATLRPITDQSGNVSPLQLSQSKAAFAGFSGAATGDIVWQANGTLTEYTGWHQSDGTYRIITKNASPLFINIDSGINFYSGFSSSNASILNSSGNWNIGHAATNAARLHVRGDGSNPIARFENSAASRVLTIDQASDHIGFTFTGGNYIKQYGVQRVDFCGYTDYYDDINNASQYGWNFYFKTRNYTASTAGGLLISGAFGAAAGSGNYRHINIAYTINNSGAQTGVATGIFLNATETNLNSMIHNLIDLQVGGSSRFKVLNNGAISVATIADASAPNSSLYFSSTANKLVWKDSGGVVNNLY